MMQRCKLLTVSTYFQHQKYHTFKCNLTGTFKTVNHFLMHIKLGEKVCDAQCIIGGPPNSDHNPVVLKLRFWHIRNEAPLRRSKPRIAWHKLNDPEITA
jgi:hypothetical protein